MICLSSEVTIFGLEVPGHLLSSGLQKGTHLRCHQENEEKKLELPPEFGGTLIRSSIWEAVVFSQVEQREVAGWTWGVGKRIYHPDQASQKLSLS